MTTSADEDYLDQLLVQTENRKLEFKAAASNFSTEKIVDYCTALANERGGILVLGVGDTLPRAVNGSSAVHDPMKMELHVHELIGIRVAIRELSYKGNRVVVISVPSRRDGEPVAHKGRYLMRAGESLTSMSTHVLAEILDERKGSPMLRVVKSRLTAAGIGRYLDLDAFFALMPFSKPSNEFDLMKELVDRELIAEEAGGTLGITRLGALLAARDLSNFPELRLRRVRIVKYANASRIDAVQERFETRGYAIGFEEMLDYLNGLLPFEEVIADGLRQTKAIYSPTALREFLANALIHQDFSEDQVQTIVEIFSDRLEIRNPGEPVIDVTRFVDETKARNPQLAEYMRMAGVCEVRGSGVDRALEQIEDLMRPAPRFVGENGATTVTLIAAQDFDSMTPEERIWVAFLHCCLKHEQNTHLTNTSLRERFGLDPNRTTVISQVIAAAVEVGLIKLDPRSGRSRRNARYLPFFVQ